MTIKIKKLKKITQALAFIVLGTTLTSSLFAETPNAAYTLAPGRGTIPILSEHYKTTPTFYDFDGLPLEMISKNIGRRFVMGPQIIMIRWYLKKAGTVMPVHFHPNEQINRVEQGELAVYSQGRKYILKPGQVMAFPPYVPHEFVALKDNTIFTDLQTPARLDFVNGDFEKRAPQVFKD